MAGANRFIQHFSHPHPLELSTFQSPQGLTSPPTLCSCCKLAPSGEIYICRPCNFILHLWCSQIPRSITHYAHGNHTLTLLSTAAYPSGHFRCNACGTPGNCFNYHCSNCSYDLHAICAHMPVNFTHQSHACTLSLTFGDPFSTTTIRRVFCSICGQSIESRDWRYKCRACDFDVHLYCCRNKASTAPGVVGGSRGVVGGSHGVVGGGHGVVSQCQHNSYLPSATTHQLQPQRPTGQGTALTHRIGEHVGVHVVGHSMGQAIFGDGTGHDQRSCDQDYDYVDSSSIWDTLSSFFGL